MRRFWLGAIAVALLAGPAGTGAQEADALAPTPEVVAPELAVPEVAAPEVVAPQIVAPQIVAMTAVLYVRTTDTVNIRAAPSTAADILGQFKRGEAVSVTGRTATAPLWYQIETREGQAGFILGIYLGPRSDAVLP